MSTEGAGLEESQESKVGGRIIKQADDCRKENDLKTASKGQIPGESPRPVLARAKQEQD